MDFLKWAVYGTHIVSFGLIFAAFVPVAGRDERKLFFRPWLLAYGIVIFALASLLDIIWKMHYLD